MRPQKVTVSSQAASAWIPVNRKQSPFNLSVSVVKSGTNTYTVQHTFDDVLAGEAATAWDSSVAALVGATTNQSGSIVAPVTAVRLNVTAWTDGNVTLTILQGS